MSSAGDDFVRILMTLTSDVEWFDSLVVLQRTTLQDAGASPDAVDHDRLSRHSERLSLEAAEMVAHARHGAIRIVGVVQLFERQRHVRIGVRRAGLCQIARRHPRKLRSIAQ